MYIHVNQIIYHSKVKPTIPMAITTKDLIFAP